jgi:hypothetical protein
MLVKTAKIDGINRNIVLKVAPVIPLMLAVIKLNPISRG